jgi:hypothetical protein
MKSILQLVRYKEVRDAVEAAITEMDRLADDLREVSADHEIHVAKVAADVEGRYVHMVVITRACGKMGVVADKLKTTAKTLRKAMTKESPPREVVEECMSVSFDDPGWMWTVCVSVLCSSM